MTILHLGLESRDASPNDDNVDRTELHSEGLDVQPLSTWQWRVCDSRLPGNDARNLLGYIEKTESGFDVLILADGYHSYTFPTLNEATKIVGSARSFAAHEDLDAFMTVRGQASTGGGSSSGDGDESGGHVSGAGKGDDSDNDQDDDNG